MAYELKEGQGTIFKNQNKKSDNHPDYNGDMLVNGTPMTIAMWVKEGKNGKYFSASIQPKRVMQSQPASVPQPQFQQQPQQEIPTQYGQQPQPQQAPTQPSNDLPF